MRLASSNSQDNAAKMPSEPVPFPGAQSGEGATSAEARIRALQSRVRASGGGAAAAAQSVELEDADDSLLSFGTERAPSGPPPASSRAGATPPARRLTPARVAVAVLVLLAVAQGAFIAARLARGSAVAAPADTGAVQVTSDPSGATVSIDDVARGATPLRTALAAGTHQVTVNHDGIVRTQTLTVARGGEASLHVELRPEPPPAAPVTPTGGLEINTTPSGAQVSIDGQPRGSAPLTISNIEPGSHVVRATRDGQTVTQTVRVREGAVSSVIISLVAPAGVTSGWLSVESPFTTQIREDGTLLGNSDTPRIMLASGRHTLELTNAALGYRSRHTVQVAAGKTTALRLDIPNGTVHLNALPWANVWMGTRQLGETPIANLSLPIGTYQLVFRHPELGEQARTVVVTAGAPVRVGVDLRKGAQ